MLRIFGEVLSTLVVVLCVVMLLIGEAMLAAVGLLLAVVAYRLWVIANQQRGQTELLALIAENQDA
jgi:hypothetical protein